MVDLTKELITKIVERTPCLECGDDLYQAGQLQFFHKPFCQHGTGLEPDELLLRLRRRAKEIKTRDSKLLRCTCGAIATGTNWVAYHNSAAIIKVDPVCYLHAIFVTDDSRMCGYLNNLISDSVSEVQKHLKGFLYQV